MVEKSEEKINLHFKWLPINQLKDIDFRPKEIKQKIEKGDIDFQHLIIK